jgi:hypothetical protein
MGVHKQKSNAAPDRCDNLSAEAGSGKLPTREMEAVTSPTLSGIVNAVLEVSRQRNALLNQLRSALQSGDDQQALQVARQLCGLSNE